MKNEEIVINQALHGYKQGHELLAASVELPPNDKRKMLYLSDSSGSDFSEAFDGYLEGYPLPSGNYVLSRTWRATEMKRPGCVWTHSLILSRNDLTILNNLSNLVDYLKRPSSIEDFSTYKEKIFVSDIGTSQTGRDSFFFDLAYSYVFHPEKQIIIPAKDKQKTENIFLNFWQLLNDEQKFSFSFCAGYFSSNQPPRESFQIVFIPKTGKRFSWDKNTAIYLDEDKKASENNLISFSDEYKEIISFSFKEEGLNKSSLENASQLYQSIDTDQTTNRKLLTPLLEGRRNYAIKLLGPLECRFKATKDIPEQELLRSILSEKFLREMEGIDTLKRVSFLTPDDAFDIFQEFLARSNNKEDRDFSIQLYDMLPTLQYAQINLAPSWFLVHLISENKPFNISTLWSLPQEEILSVLSQSLTQNKTATINLLEKSSKAVSNKKIDLWLLQNIREEDFEAIVNKFNLNITQLSRSELKKLISRFPLKVLKFVNLEEISEDLANDLLTSSLGAGRGDLFFEKLNATDPLRKIKWKENLWLKIISDICNNDLPIFNTVFLKVYPHLLGLLSEKVLKEKRSKWSEILPFSNFFKPLTSIDNLRLMLLSFVISKRISVADFLSCLTTKDEVKEICSFLVSSEYERRELRTLLNNCSEKEQYAERIHLFLKTLDDD